MNVRTMLSAIVALTLAGCGLSSPDTARSTAAHPAAAVAPALTVPIKPANGSHAAGTATVTTAQGAFTVHLVVKGLQADTTHPAHVHAGRCGSNGPVIYPLKDLVAGPDGVASATTTISHPYHVPASGWFINVHHGPALSGGGATPIACGDLPPH